MTNIAFIGLGNMGGPMAANLVKGGHRVTGFDLDCGSCEAAEEAGVVLANSAGATVRDAEVVITMLPAGGILAVQLFTRAGFDPLLSDQDPASVNGRARYAHVHRSLLLPILP